MKLQTNQLKQFKAAASAIKQNNILPILSYLKFDNGTITKNNLESFIIMDSDFEGTMLIDEKVLMNFVDFTSASEITATVKGTQVIITDGKTKVTSPTDEVKNFPTNTETDTEQIELSANILYAIKAASNFTMDDQSMPFKEFIFVGNNIVTASNGFIFYGEKTTGAPQITIGKDAASAITKFESVLFSENDTYQFYSNGIYKFGFIKKDIKFLDMTKFMNLPESDKVEVNKSELIKFCDMCISNTPGRVVTAKVDGNLLSMVDAGYGINIETNISATLDTFGFSPAYMIRMLKSLPGETLQFIRGKNKYYITGETGFVSLIMESVNN